MIEAQRRAYLEALDITVWLHKPDIGGSAEAETQSLSVEPGGGSILLLCRDHEESGTPVARDLGRFLGEEAIWGWPDPASDPAGPTVADAVDQRLFTRIIVFGASLAERLFGESVPEVVGSAGVSISADLDELALSGECRKSLWRLIRDLGPTAA